MEVLKVDSGIREFQVGCGVLRFNPADPNLYVRFSDAVEQLREMEQALASQASGEGAQVLTLMKETDRKIKNLLEQALGPGNDLDSVLCGVNLLAVADNGCRVVENLMAALQPVLAEGARAWAKQEAAVWGQPLSQLR